MNKLVLYGGIGAVALVGFMVLKPKAATATQDSSNASMPLSYATGFGANALSAGSISGGSTSSGSAAELLANAVNQKSTNDLQLGLAQTDATKTLGLASIASNLQTTLTELGNSRLHDVFASVPILAKNGVSGVFADVNPDGHISSNILYTDNSKNASLVTGYNAKGDLITLDNTIQKQYVAPVVAQPTPGPGFNQGAHGGSSNTSVYSPTQGWGTIDSSGTHYP